MVREDWGTQNKWGNNVVKKADSFEAVVVANYHFPALGREWGSKAILVNETKEKGTEKETNVRSK